MTIKRGSERGAALITVLWIALFLSVLLAMVGAATRVDSRTTEYRLRNFVLQQALIDGLEFAAQEFAANRMGHFENLWSLRFTINNHTVTFSRSPESQKLDVNHASERTMAGFFRFLGVDADLAADLAARVADWRDEDDLVRYGGGEAADYAAARNGERIGNRPFHSVDEIKLVLGMPASLVECARPALTIFGDGSAPDTALLVDLYHHIAPVNPQEVPVGSGPANASVGAVQGRLYSVLARIAADRSDREAPTGLIGVFRITGAPKQPFDWIVMFPQEITARQPGTCTPETFT